MAASVTAIVTESSFAPPLKPAFNAVPYLVVIAGIPEASWRHVAKVLVHALDVSPPSKSPAVATGAGSVNVAGGSSGREWGASGLWVDEAGGNSCSLGVTSGAGSARG